MRGRGTLVDKGIGETTFEDERWPPSEPTLITDGQMDVDGQTSRLKEKLQGFPMKDAKMLKYLKSIFPIISSSQSSLARLGIFFNFEKRASFDAVSLRG